jgi:hypothetical protein
MVKYDIIIISHFGEGSGELFRFSRIGKQSGFARVRNRG